MGATFIRKDRLCQDRKEEVLGRTFFLRVLHLVFTDGWCLWVPVISSSGPIVIAQPKKTKMAEALPEV